MISNIKTKISSIVQGAANNENDTPLTKKIELLSVNFKSVPTIFSRDLKIEGDIFSAGLIEIEGCVKGTIKGNSIIIREAGFVDGDIFSESLNIKGRFSGNIKAKNINICGKASVIGNIEYSSLSVEDGASIDGQFKKNSAE